MFGAARAALGSLSFMSLAFVSLACVSAVAEPPTLAARSPAVDARSAGALFVQPLSLRATSDGPVVLTLLDYVQSGHQRALQYLERERPRGVEVGVSPLSGCRDLCTRVEILERASGGGRFSVLASGGLVADGGRLITAGHSFQGGPVEVQVTLRDGRQRTARVLERRHDPSEPLAPDWALLELEGPSLDLPGLPLGQATVGEIVLVLGYPDRIGIDGEGRAVPGLLSAGRALDPVVFVGRVRRTQPLELEPVAGSIPLGGASGSAVCNLNGELVGVLTSVATLAYPDGLRYSYQASPSSDFAALLRRE